jgi:hypothetical protein
MINGDNGCGFDWNHMGILYGNYMGIIYIYAFQMLFIVVKRKIMKANVS